MTKGYLYRPEANKEKIRDGWLYTGDIGYLDEDGFLYVLDRRSDLIISGGENIYPAEIEAVLLAHPDVADAGVTGIEDANWGQVPIAFIVKKENSYVTEDELRQFCLEQLAKYKVPQGFRFIDALPRNASKKLLRRKLREWVKDGKESMMKISSIQLYVIKMPLKTPFITHLDTVTEREGIIVEVTDADGLSGYGEGVAFSSPWYTEETVKTCLHMLTDFLIPLIAKTSDRPSKGSLGII